MSDEIEEGEPKRPRKKKLPPPDDEDERPRKKRRPRDEDDEEEEEDDDDDNDLGKHPLSAVVPLGGSIWALAAFWLSILSCFIPGVWLLSIGLAAVAFLTHKHKASYGSVTGNMRALLAIVISLVAIVLQVGGLIVWYTTLKMP